MWRSMVTGKSTSTRMYVELERASSRGKEKHTLAQEQAEEAPAPEEGGREREQHRICEDFEVVAQRLQDVTNAFETLGPARLCSRCQRLRYFHETHSETTSTDLSPLRRTRPTTNADGHRFGYVITRTHESRTALLVRYSQHPVRRRHYLTSPYRAT